MVLPILNIRYNLHAKFHTSSMLQYQLHLRHLAGLPRIVEIARFFISGLWWLGNLLWITNKNTVSGDLLDLGTVIIVENSHRIGILNTELKMCVRWLIAFFGKHLVIDNINTKI